MRPIETSVCGTWAMTGGDEMFLCVFIVTFKEGDCVTYGDNGVSYRILMTHELDDLILKKSNIIRFAKSRRISCFGHKMRMGDYGIFNRAKSYAVEGRGLGGRPQKR